MTMLNCIFGYFFCFMIIYTTYSMPLSDDNEAHVLSNETTNSTDLLVIKTIVYEVGILTDSDDNSTTTSESEERIDLTFYNPEHTNLSIFNLSNLQIPLQTNFSELTLTNLTPITYNGNNNNKINVSDGPSLLNIPNISNILFGNVRNVSTNNTLRMKEIVKDVKELEDDDDTSSSLIDDEFV